MTRNRIEKKAAHWLIELDTASNPAELWPKFQAWLDEDPRHRSAFNSMEEAWKAVDDLRIFHIGMDGERVGSPLTNRETRRRRLPRAFYLMMAALALIAIALVCVI
jgi:ferric-dicitrate binding protein FerR (iron transport regulator)